MIKVNYSDNLPFLTSNYFHASFIVFLTGNPITPSNPLIDKLSKLKYFFAIMRF